MKVIDITPKIVTSGRFVNRPATFVTFDKTVEQKDEMDFNDVVDSVRKAGHSSVVIVGRLDEFGDIKTLANGLAKLNHNVIVWSDASDNAIDVLRTSRGISFHSVVASIPTGQSNTISPKLIPMLQEADVLAFTIGSEKDYTDAVAYLKTKGVIRPMIQFEIDKKLDDKDRADIVSKFLKDAAKLKFRAAIS